MFKKNIFRKKFAGIILSLSLASFSIPAFATEIKKEVSPKTFNLKKNLASKTKKRSKGSEKFKKKSSLTTDDISKTSSPKTVSENTGKVAKGTLTENDVFNILKNLLPVLDMHVLMMNTEVQKKLAKVKYSSQLPKYTWELLTIANDSIRAKQKVYKENLEKISKELEIMNKFCEEYDEKMAGRKKDQKDQIVTNTTAKILENTKGLKENLDVVLKFMNKTKNNKNNSQIQQSEFEKLQTAAQKLLKIKNSGEISLKNESPNSKKNPAKLKKNTVSLKKGVAKKR